MGIILFILALPLILIVLYIFLLISITIFNYVFIGILDKWEDRWFAKQKEAKLVEKYRKEYPTPEI